MNLGSGFGQVDGLDLVNLLLDDPFLLHKILDLFLKVLLRGGVAASCIIADF
jgi:hypothetical protein